MDTSREPEKTITESGKENRCLKTPPPAFVVTEAEGIFYTEGTVYPDNSAASSTKSPDEPAQPPKPPSIKPWMVMLAVCLLAGAGISVALALNPPSRLPVVEESYTSTQSTQTEFSEKTLPALSPLTAPTKPSMWYEPTTASPDYIIEKSLMNGELQIYLLTENSIYVKGILDRDGGTVIPPVYTDIRILSPQRFLVAQGDKWGLVNRENKILYPIEADTINSLVNYEGNPLPLLIEKNGQWLLYDVDGNQLSDTVWHNMEFAEGTIIAAAGDTHFSIDYQGNILTEISDEPRVYQEYYDGALKLMCRYGPKGQYFGVQDKEGKTIIPADYPDIKILNPHRILVYTSADPYDAERLAAVFDNRGKIVLDFVYQDLTAYPNANGDYAVLLALKETERMVLDRYVLDLDGNQILQEKFESHFDYDHLAHHFILYADLKKYTVDLGGSIVDVEENPSHYPNT